MQAVAAQLHWLSAEFVVPAILKNYSKILWNFEKHFCETILCASWPVKQRALSALRKRQIKNRIFRTHLK